MFVRGIVRVVMREDLLDLEITDGFVKPAFAWRVEFLYPTTTMLL